MTSFKPTKEKIIKQKVSDFEKKVKKIHRFAILETSGVKNMVYTEKGGILLAMDNKSVENAWKKALHRII